MIPRLKKVAGQTPLLVMLRDPVKRAYSHYQMAIDPEGTPAQLRSRGGKRSGSGWCWAGFGSGSGFGLLVSTMTSQAEGSRGECRPSSGGAAQPCWSFSTCVADGL